MGETSGGGVSGGVSGGVNNLLDFIKANPGKKSKEIKAALNLAATNIRTLVKRAARTKEN